MKLRFLSIGVAMALAAFACTASAESVIYDHFDNAATLGDGNNGTLWYTDTPSGFKVPTISSSSMNLASIGGVASDINSKTTWTVGTALEFKLSAAPTGAGCFGYGIGAGGNSACLRNDQEGSRWQFVVDDNSGVNIYRSGDLFNDGTPAAGKVYSIVWKADSMSLLEDGTQLASAAGRSLSGNWGAFAYTGNTMSWDYVATSTVPEPSTIALLMTGVFGLLAYAWRKRR
jgi:hypothetical protein